MTRRRYSRQHYVFPRLPAAAYTPTHKVMSRSMCHPEWGYGWAFRQVVWSRARALLLMHQRQLWSDWKAPC